MRHGALAAVMAGALLGSTSAFAQSAQGLSADLQCTFRHPIVEISLIDEMPRQIQNIMLARMDSQAREDGKFQWHSVMAPRGQPFNSTDVIVREYAPRRFIRAGHDGADWFVWYERGGIAYTKHILAFHLRPGHGVPVVRASMTYLAQDPCGLTDDLLDGKAGPGSLESDW